MLLGIAQVSLWLQIEARGGSMQLRRSFFLVLHSLTPLSPACVCITIHDQFKAEAYAAAFEIIVWPQLWIYTENRQKRDVWGISGG